MPTSRNPGRVCAAPLSNTNAGPSQVIVVKKARLGHAGLYPQASWPL